MKKGEISIENIVFYCVCFLYLVYQFSYAIGEFVGNYENEINKMP
jgi:hypothetical protein